MPLSPIELRAKLRGPLAFPITPFDASLAVDLVGLRANVRILLDDPPVAIVAAGGTGELYSLTPGEHLSVVRAVVEECGGAVPVIAGVGFNPALGAELAIAAAGAGADGILAFPPYYPHADEAGLLAYYRAIGQATRLGLLIYSRDWFHPGAALVEQLASIDTLICWKDGQGDIRRLQMIMEVVGDRLHWIGGAGDDMVPAYYATGIRAYTSSVSNLSMRLAHTLHDYAIAGDPRLPGIMTELIVPLYALRARRRGYEVSVMKTLMDRLGIAGGPVRPPLPDVDEATAGVLAGLAPRFRAWASKPAR
ncbi:MAG: dihydrodipicolinate synthase family protein [Acidobacteriota bacterium]